MKKILILGILVLFLGSLMAAESGPSDTVGFFKIDVPVGFTAFSIPFNTYVAGVETWAISDVIGTQLVGGLAFQSDKIWDITNNTSATKDGAGNWVGFTDFIDGHAYYVQNKHTATDLYVYGTVVEDACDYGTMAVGFNAFSVNSAKEVLLDDLDLTGFTGGLAFQSDKIWDITNNTTATMDGAGNWVGFDHVIPTHSYYLQNKHAAFAWAYDPLSREGEDGKYFTPEYKPVVEKSISPKFKRGNVFKYVPTINSKKDVKK